MPGLSIFHKHDRTNHRYSTTSQFIISCRSLDYYNNTAKDIKNANIANETSDVFILDGKLCFPVKCLGDQFVKETVVLFEPNAMSEHPLAKASKEQQCRRLGYFFASKLAKPQL